MLTHRGVSEWWGGIDDTSPDVLNLRRELFYLWGFIAKEELLEEATDFIEEYRNIPAPIENWLN